jgi:hypothetical protein
VGVWGQAEASAIRFFLTSLPDSIKFPRKSEELPNLEQRRTISSGGVIHKKIGHSIKNEDQEIGRRTVREIYLEEILEYRSQKTD